MMLSEVGRMRRASFLAFALAAAGWVSLLVGAQAESEPAGQKKTVEEGKLLYGIYCQSCHGSEGRGDGPMARSLKPRPADLTVLSRNNGDEFPLARVLLSIDGRSRVPGQRKGHMPIWGLSLQEADADINQEDEVREKIEYLIEYLKSIQSKSR
jgi:mono/diheme cytochrome c family protein